MAFCVLMTNKTNKILILVSISLLFVISLFIHGSAHAQMDQCSNLYGFESYYKQTTVFSGACFCGQGYVWGPYPVTEELKCVAPKSVTVPPVASTNTKTPAQAAHDAQIQQQIAALDPACVKNVTSQVRAKDGSAQTNQAIKDTLAKGSTSDPVVRAQVIPYLNYLYSLIADQNAQLNNVLIKYCPKYVPPVIQQSISTTIVAAPTRPTIAPSAPPAKPKVVSTINASTALNATTSIAQPTSTSAPAKRGFWSWLVEILGL